MAPKLRIVMNNAVGRLWREAVVDFISIISHDSLGVTEENGERQ
jgi:hypothetical protein